MSSEYDISAKITYDTSGATAAIGQTTKALGDNVAATAKAGEATAKTSTNLGQFGSTVGLAGQALGKMNPALGQTVTTGAAALGSIQALTTAGLGPLGIAIGVASIAITAATSALAYFVQKQADAKKATDDATKALLHNADAFDELMAAQQRQQGVADRFARLSGGTGSAAEYRARGEQLAEELRLTQQQRAAAREAGGMDDAARSRRLELSTIEERLTRDIAVNEERRAAAVAAASVPQVVIEEGATLTGAAAIAADPRGHRPRGGRGGGRARPDDAAAPDTREADQQREQWAADNLARITEEMDAEAEVRSRMRASEIDEANGAKDRAIEIAQEQRDAILEIKKAEADELAAIQAGVAGGFGVLSDAMQVAAESSGASAEMQKKIMAGAALAEAVVQGALEVARAAASYPDIAGMVAHGTAAAAFGVAAVKAGIAMGGGGGATSGGGGGGAAAPTGGPSLSSGSHERGGDTIVINWGSQGLVYAADRAQLGRDIEDLIGAGRSRLGRAA